MKYSPIEEIEKKLCSIEDFLAQNDIFLEKTKDIPYGVQIFVQGPNEEGKINIYYSEKKGFSIVDNIKNDITQKLAACIDKPRIEPKIKRFLAHFGSDETGKGDFFGPLVTAGFFVDSLRTQEDLIKLGVCDSKKLTDKKIAEVANILHSNYPDNIVIVAPTVQRYNELYAKFRNLNVLLGWAHARVIEKFNLKFPKVKLAAFDKFADESLVTRFLQEIPELKVDAVVHGEDNDIAIAAASIIARNYFVQRMEELSGTYKIQIPFGAGNSVISAGKTFLAKHGWQKLELVAKLHFKTVEKLR